MRTCCLLPQVRAALFLSMLGLIDGKVRWKDEKTNFFHWLIFSLFSGVEDSAPLKKGSGVASSGTAAAQAAFEMCRTTVSLPKLQVP